ncbi:MAG: glycosyltransferase family 4 protein [Chloroflexi bacterium]|nr:glycosyltransferase family 4 protein [Chloroflexota bacterium]
MSRPRVLLTTDVVGGVWDFSVCLAAELSADWQVTLLALGVPTVAQRADAAAAGAALRVEPVKLEWMQDSAADVAHTRQLVSHIATQGYDLIHANQFAAACAEVDVPVVLTLHSDVLSWRRWTLGTAVIPPAWMAYRDLVRDALVRATRVVAVSRFLAQEVQELYACGRDIEVIHNGWSASPANAPRQPTTLVAGRIWDAAKNVSLAATAASGWTPGEVLLAGERRHPESLMAAEVPPPLHPLGVLDRADLQNLLDRISVYLSPARYDPFGLVPLQAAQHGCALLLSDIPSYRELWDGAACFFKSGDADDLRRKWRLLLAQSDVRQAFARAARARAQSSYSAARMAAQYRAVYATTCMRRVA